jgi:hypothetical protein
MRCRGGCHRTIRAPPEGGALTKITHDIYAGVIREKVIYRRLRVPGAIRLTSRLVNERKEPVVRIVSGRVSPCSKTRRKHEEGGGGGEKKEGAGACGLPRLGHCFINTVTYYLRFRNRLSRRNRGRGLPRYDIRGGGRLPQYVTVFMKWSTWITTAVAGFYPSWCSPGRPTGRWRGRGRS